MLVKSQLSQSLDAVVEDCVNAVGVDVNTASSPLLARVSGLNVTIANKIVDYRNEYGPFKNRNECLKRYLGWVKKAFEQAAGFLRINNGDNPLDASAVHPETYSVVDGHHSMSVNRDIRTSYWCNSSIFEKP